MTEDWPLAESYLNYCKPSLTLKQLARLREFYMVQQALALELQEAKSLGICKTSTLPREELLTLKRYSSDVSKEML